MHFGNCPISRILVFFCLNFFSVAVRVELESLVSGYQNNARFITRRHPWLCAACGQRSEQIGDPVLVATSSVTHGSDTNFFHTQLWHDDSERFDIGTFLRARTPHGPAGETCVCERKRKKWADIFGLTAQAMHTAQTANWFLAFLFLIRLYLGNPSHCFRSSCWLAVSFFTRFGH